MITNCEGKDATGAYYRLVDGKSCGEKERMFLEAQENGGKAIVNSKLYIVNYNNVAQQDFEKIPGCPIGYWVSEKVLKLFLFKDNISKLATPRKGLATTDNKRFLRFWHEVSFSSVGIRIKDRATSISSMHKWFPLNKGGEFRKWYGNINTLINWYKDGMEIKDAIVKAYNGGSYTKEIRSEERYFQDSITWNALTSGTPSFRFSDYGALFDSAGSSMFPSEKNMLPLLALLNTPIAKNIFDIINPTLNYGAGTVGALPVLDFSIIDVSLVSQNISISKQDWDAHETSWDFQRNPLYEQFLECMEDDLQNVIPSGTSLEELSKFAVAEAMHPLTTCLHNYKDKWEVNFMRLHKNEEELNRQFIDIYGLQDELTPDVPFDEITILQQGEISIENDRIKWHDDVAMKQFVSYAVGCMMGRYSIDKPGLILANQGDGLNEYNEKVPNSRFEVDDDGIIPLMTSDTEFSDNATHRFKQWLAIAFGDTHLVENLNFIEGALGKSLDDYFVKDFWKDHKKMYQNRPIYWLFASKKGAFQCIAYMHRMNAYTAERIRTKYLLPHIEWLMQKQSEMEENAANLSTAERKKLDSIRKQIDECREYHDRLHVVADEQIAFDLDDGVVVNYAKFGDVVQKIK